MRTKEVSNPQNTNLIPPKRRYQKYRCPKASECVHIACCHTKPHRKNEWCIESTEGDEYDGCPQCLKVEEVLVET
jgi:hypothetical protein